MADEEHVITVAPSSKPDARDLWQARCSCRNYVSAPVTRFAAYEHGNAHVGARALIKKWKAEDADDNR